MDSVVTEVDSVQTAHALADDLLTVALQKAIELQAAETAIYEAEQARVAAEKKRLEEEEAERVALEAAALEAAGGDEPVEGADGGDDA
mmetsp:Transcript_11468/g.20077  ORF Transcript_11468/g.20077 Transcript_11468/m.20077 type:complete len:88 (-) Transcript_11468:115-378(-)